MRTAIFPENGRRMMSEMMCMCRCMCMSCRCCGKEKCAPDVRFEFCFIDMSIIDRKFIFAMEPVTFFV